MHTGIGKDNAVRIVDVSVDKLDLTFQGFSGATPSRALVARLAVHLPALPPQGPM
jgi:hypothetical protein